ncbi:MAG: hypothetical protein KDB69_03275 [Acidimicrobiia bacterium]|nr:hypothetical protein [Acidimicrobiia bacterium]
MNSKTTTHRLVGFAGLAVAFASAPAGAQATFEWLGNGDGQSFSDSANWSPVGLPGTLDEAKFDSASSWVVTFSSNPFNAITSIENDTVQFNLGTRTYTTRALSVGERLGDVGMLTLQGGTFVTTTGLAQVGRLSPSTGTLHLTGGTALHTQRDLIIGDEGDGSLVIDAGSSATSLITFIADEEGSSGDAVIRGLWTIQNSALIGNSGDGAMTVEAGGDVVVGFETKVGDNDFSTGSLTVTGAGSTLTSTAPTTIGNFGTGSLVVSNGGLLTTAQLKIADDATGSVLVSGGSIVDTVGTTVGNRATGSLTLANGGTVQSPLVSVAPIGTLGGSGTIQGNVLSNGTTAPGSTLGALQITGTYTQPLGTVNIQIGGTTAGVNHDQIVVGGTATLGGTLNVTLVNGFNPTDGEFVIVQGGTVTGTFAVENLPLGFSIAYEAGRVVVSIGDSSCIADFNNDGFVDFFDVVAFLAVFNDGTPEADLNNDGVIDFFDVVAFLNEFTIGC